MSKHAIIFHHYPWTPRQPRTASMTGQGASTCLGPEPSLQRQLQTKALLSVPGSSSASGQSALEAAAEAGYFSRAEEPGRVVAPPGSALQNASSCRSRPDAAMYFVLRPLAFRPENSVYSVIDDLHEVVLSVSVVCMAGRGAKGPFQVQCTQTTAWQNAASTCGAQQKESENVRTRALNLRLTILGLAHLRDRRFLWLRNSFALQTSRAFANLRGLLGFANLRDLSPAGPQPQRPHELRLL